MTAINSSLPFICMALSLFSILPTVLIKNNRFLRNSFLLMTILACVGSVGLMIDLWLHNGLLLFAPIYLVANVALKFRVDGLGLVFALLASILWLLTSIYSFGYFKVLKLNNEARFLIFFALAIFATLGVAFSGNLLTLYLFYELLSLLTYPLVCHEQTAEAKSAGRKYLAYTIGSSLLLILPTLAVIYYITGTLDFTKGGILDGKLPDRYAAILFFMLLFGFSKAAIMPLHGWLPAAMVAPTPVSALLHAVAVVKVGVFGLIRVITEIYGPNYLADLAIYGYSVAELAGIVVSITIILGSLIALKQDNIKLRLAYSTVSQLSYIVLGVLVLAPRSITAAGLHMVMHGFGKITLFFCAGAIYIVFNQKYLSNVLGAGRYIPGLTLALLIGALTVVGLPPTGGFISKWQLMNAAVTSSQLWFAGVYVLSSLLSATYLVGLVVDFGCWPNKTVATVRKLPLSCSFAIAVTALSCLVLFFNDEWLIRVLEL